MPDNRDELIQLLKDTNESLRQQNQVLVQQVANLQETVASMARKLFGASSEQRHYEVEGQLSLFNEAEALLNPDLPEPAIEEVLKEYGSKSRKARATRKDLLDGLPIEKVICRVSEEDRICEWCNTQLELIGTKFVREEIQVIPARVKRIHFYQEVFGCPTCKPDAPVIVEAATPAPLFKHSFASASSVAYVMYQKYVNSNPLYRQELDWVQRGVSLSRATMANWVIKAGLDYPHYLDLTSTYHIFRKKQ